MWLWWGEVAGVAITAISKYEPRAMFMVIPLAVFRLVSLLLMIMDNWVIEFQSGV